MIDEEQAYISIDGTGGLETSAAFIAEPRIQPATLPHLTVYFTTTPKMKIYLLTVAAFLGTVAVAVPVNVKGKWFLPSLRSSKLTLILKNLLS